MRGTWQLDYFIILDYNTIINQIKHVHDHLSYLVITNNRLNSLFIAHGWFVFWLLDEFKILTIMQY